MNTATYQSPAAHARALLNTADLPTRVAVEHIDARIYRESRALREYEAEGNHAAVDYSVSELHDLADELESWPGLDRYASRARRLAQAYGA